MQQAKISPGWALLAIFILWGIAGALDQPLEGTETVAEAEPMLASPPIQLHCQAVAAFQEEGGAPGRTGTVDQRLRRVTASSGRLAPQMSPVPPTALFCLVIDE